MLFRDRYKYDPSDKTRPLIYIKNTIHHIRARQDKVGYLINKKNARGVSARIKIGKKTFQYHRVVWMFFNGEIPDGMTIDHINGDIQDNRIENLQCVSREKNKRVGVSKLYKNNSSGMTGVLYDSNIKKWKVSFKHKNKLYYFGVYEDIEEAKRVCLEKRISLFTESRRNFATQ